MCTVRVAADLFGPWESADMPLSTWLSAIEEKQHLQVEYSSPGLLFAGDAAADIVNVIPSCGAFEQWEVYRNGVRMFFLKRIAIV